MTASKNSTAILKLETWLCNCVNDEHKTFSLLRKEDSNTLYKTNINMLRTSFTPQSFTVSCFGCQAEIQSCVDRRTSTFCGDLFLDYLGS